MDKLRPHGIPRLDRGTSSFSEVAEVGAVLRKMGYVEPTRVQKLALPLVRARRDLIGLSETGTGKTACFTIPMVEELSEDLFGVYALILTPTRELCAQIKEQVDILGDHLNVKSVAIHGGVDVHKQVASLSRRPHVVVATARRLAALLCTDELVRCFSKVRRVVLDEADILIGGSHSADIMDILSRLAGSFQMLLFSATDVSPSRPQTLRSTGNPGPPRTETNALWEFVRSRDPETVDAREKQIPRAVKQEYAMAPGRIRDVHMARLLLEEWAGERVIVFTNRSDTCVLLSEMLPRLGIRSAGLCRGMAQGKRTKALSEFKHGLVDVLVTTDIASRGLDVKDVLHVINYNLPAAHTDYIHRVGRTGRAGKEGHALSFVGRGDAWILKEIEAKTNEAIKEAVLPEIRDLRLMNKVSTQREVALGLLRKRSAAK